MKFVGKEIEIPYRRHIPDALKKRMIANTKPFILVRRCDDDVGSIPPAAASASSPVVVPLDVLATVDVWD